MHRGVKKRRDWKYERCFVFGFGGPVRGEKSKVPQQERYNEAVRQRQDGGENKRGRQKMKSGQQLKSREENEPCF